MARLYSNENFPLPVVVELQRMGHDILTSFASGRAGQRIPDPQVLDFAAEQERVLVTMNRRHFIRLHEHSPNHFGIVVCTFDPNFVALAERIDRHVQSAGDTRGKLIRINRPN